MINKKPLRVRPSTSPPLHAHTRAHTRTQPSLSTNPARGAAPRNRQTTLSSRATLKAVHIGLCILKKDFHKEFAYAACTSITQYVGQPARQPIYLFTRCDRDRNGGGARPQPNLNSHPTLPSDTRARHDEHDGTATTPIEHLSDTRTHAKHATLNPAWSRAMMNDSCTSIDAVSCRPNGLHTCLHTYLHTPRLRRWSVVRYWVISSWSVQWLISSRA